MLKNYAKVLGKAILLVVACILIGFMLILAVYAIPTTRIEANVQESADIFVEEGEYPVSSSIFGNDYLDNFTDALMLLIASYSGDENLLEKAMTANRAYIEDESPTEVLIAKYVENESVTYKSYDRYWHGYLVYLKPLLCVFSYGQIRSINSCLVMLIAIILIAILYKKDMRRYIIPYLLAWFLINPIAIGQSLQYSSIYYTYSIAAILFLLNKEKFLASEEKFLLFMVTIGCVTSYFDFLTYPLVTFGIPITLYACASKEKCAKIFKTVVLALAAWGIGYVGMWAGKWVLGSLFSSQNIIAEAFEQILFRSSMENEGAAFSIINVLINNLYHFKKLIFILPVIYIITSGVYFIIKARKKNLCDYLWVVLIFICLLPFAWYAGASNHSFLHHQFTYRELMISAFAGMCLFARYATKKATPNMIEK